MVDAPDSSSVMPTPNPQSPTAADLWRQVEAYARATGDIDLDMVIAAIAASEGVPPGGRGATVGGAAHDRFIGHMFQ